MRARRVACFALVAVCLLVGGRGRRDGDDGTSFRDGRGQEMTEIPCDNI
jgi:hypothetical protein